MFRSRKGCRKIKFIVLILVKIIQKWSWLAEIKSVPDWKCISPKQISLMIASKNNGFGHAIFIQIPRIKQPIPSIL